MPPNGHVGPWVEGVPKLWGRGAGVPTIIVMRPVAHIDPYAQQGKGFVRQGLQTREHEVPIRAKPRGQPKLGGRERAPEARAPRIMPHLIRCVRAAKDAMVCAGDRLLPAFMGIPAVPEGG